MRGMRRFYGMLLVGWLGLIGGVRADMVDDLSRIHVEALGGEEALAELNALRAIGHSTLGDQRMRFVMWAELPNRVRIESIDATRTQTQAWDGEAPPWRQTRGPTGRSAAEEMTRSEAAQFVQDTDFDDPLVDVRARGGSVDYAGEGEVAGRKTHRLLVTRNLVHQVVVHLDAETYLIVQQERVQDPGTAREVTRITRFFDYQAVDGVKLPRRVEVSVNGRTRVTTVLDEIDANPLIPPRFFSMP